MSCIIDSILNREDYIAPFWGWGNSLQCTIQEWSVRKLYLFQAGSICMHMDIIKYY